MRRLGWMVGAGVLVVGCARAKMAATDAPMETAQPEVSGSEDHDLAGAADADLEVVGDPVPGLEAYEVRLRDLETQLAAVGVGLEGAVAGGAARFEAEAEPASAKEAGRAVGKNAKKAETGDPVGRCERVCGLAEAMCSLEARICQLAERHADEPRYVRACTRAGRHCEVASEACHACSG